MAETESTPRARRVSVRVAAAAFALLVCGAGVGWAVSEVLRPDDTALAASPSITATVSPGEVSQSLELNAAAQWEAGTTVTNRASGTVTSVDLAPGAEVTAGQQLYAVDLRPVHAAAGTTPMSRDLSDGTIGPDVAQLQAMLASIGIDPGRTDGVFDDSTERAVRAWQSRAGLPVDGTVALRDLVFLPGLPARARLDATVVFAGAILGGTEPALTVLGAPTFTIALDDLQNSLVPQDATVTVTGPENAWTATAGDRTRGETGTIVTLEAAGAPVCADDCVGAVPALGQSLFPATITVVPLTTGLTVPSAAIATEADGRAVVIDSADRRHPVTVIAAAQGISVVEGLEDGLVVRVPAEPARTQP